MRTFTQKKWAFLLMVVLFGCCLQVNAQSDLTVADGTSTSSYLPLYGLNADTQGMKGQCLYPADSLTDMAGGSISQITFYCGSTVPAEVWGGTFIVYLGETDESNLSSAFISTDDLTAVYTGTLDATSGTLTIEFDEAYTYQGGNLVVDVTLSVTGNWKSASFLGVNNLTGSGRYRTSGSGAGTATAFLPKAEFVYTPGGSVGPTCDKPETVEANDVTSNSATINWIGTASAYNLQYKASADADWTLVKNLSVASYQLTNLVSNTAYQVQVQAICGENTSGWRSVSFNTLIGLPYAENFDAAPSGWNRYTGTLNDDGSAALTATTSYWTFGTYNDVFDKHAHIEVYSTRNAWLVTPSIPIPAMEDGDPGYHMLFNLALTYWTGANVPAPAAQAGAHLYVLASMDGGNNWATLREWNNTGSPYVFDDITCSAEGEEVDLDLTAYAGQTIQLAFYLATSGSGDNRIHIDNLLVEEMPTCLKPTGLHAVDGVATSSTLPVAWTANSGEAAWRLQYKPTADAEAEWITLDIAANPYTITGLSAFTEYEVRVAAVCTEEDFTDYGKSIIAKTAAVVPFAQTFDTTSMPVEWKRYEALLEAVQQSGAQLEASKNGWSVGLKNGVFGNEHLYLNIKGTDTKHWLVSPVIEMLEGYQLTFDLALTTNAGSTPTAVTAGEQNDDQFIVFISNNGGADWTALGTWGNQGQGTSFDQISTEGQTVKFDLSAYAGQSIMLAFYGESTEANGDNNLHISNVAIDLIPACERPLSITLGSVTGTTAEITWDADEEGTWEYGYVANPAADFAPAEEDYTANTTDKIAELSELSETTDYVFFVRRACSETEKSEPLMKTFKTIQTPAELPYVGDFEETNGWLLINGEYVNKWVRGTAVANGGTHALYISNDNGVSAAYTNNSACVVYATKTFFFPEAGMYSFSFDWMCNGEGNYDYLRVALVPASVEVEAATALPTGLGTTTLPEGWIALDGGSKLNLSSVWQTKRNELNIEQMGYYKVVLVWRDDTSGGTAPGAAIDNVNISRLTCRMPNGLTLGDVTANSAAFSWNDDEDGMTWVYACVPAGQEPTEFTAVAENSVLVEGLTECTAYDFYLRKHCGENEESEPVMISFQTKQMPAEVGVLFSDDFEDGNHWLFNNGTLENAWAYGTAAHNGEGTHALYISNDGGTTNAYTLNKTTVVFASKLFHFQNGAYTFQYDWRANGEGASTRYDYLRVALVPEDAEFVAGTTLPTGVTYQALPAGCVALDGGIALNLQADWQTFATDAINIEEGNYKVVLLWRNDSGSGSQTPAAVDNFSISRIVCATPADFAAIDTTATTTSIELTWTPMSDETSWVVRYREQGAEEWAAVVPAAADTFLLEGLNPSTIYEAQVATQCDPEDATAIGTYSASITFATECVPFATVDEDFEGSLICWSAVQDGNGYPIILSNYPEDAHSGSKFLYFASQVGYEPQDEYIVLPELISLENMRMKFYACHDLAEPTEAATLVVGVMPAPADTANFVALDTIVLTTAIYNQYVVPFSAYTGDGKYVAIKMLAAQTALASARIEDVVVDEIPNCMEPVGPIAVTAVTADSAYLSWPAEENGAWKYAFAPANSAEPADEAFIAVTDTFVAIGDLEDCTPYIFYLRRDCGTAQSPSITAGFTTLLKPATAPFADDFETVNKWQFINGTLTNAWAYGEAAHNGEGTHAIYISNDNGVTNAYTHSATTVFAVKPFHFEEGNFIFQYDWKAKGESSYDLLRVALAPASVELEASSAMLPGLGSTSGNALASALPDGWIALDGGSKLNLVDAWQTYRSDAIAIAEGDYKVVLIWRNDGSGGSQTPAAVDNFIIEKLTCIRPDSLAVVEESITNHSAQIDWSPISGESNWLIQYKKAAEEAWTLVAEDVNVHPFTINGLDASSVYEIRVAAWCDPTDSAAVSDHSMPVTVMTECEAISVFPFGENFDSYTGVTSGTLMPICWNQINTCTYSSYSYYPTTYKSSTYANSGENSLRFYSYYYNSTTTNYDPQDQYAILPEMDDVNTLRLKFSARAYSTSYAADFYIGVMSNPSDMSTFEPITYIDLESTTYQAFDIKLNSYQGTGKYIAIKMLASTGSYRGFHIDDILVEKLPACMEPEDVVASNFTATSATISWTNGAAGQEAWQIAYSCDPEFNVADATPIDIASNPYELTGLEADTLYTVYVRANCGETDGTSLWATTSFRTAKSCQTPDDLAAADITINSASINWNGYGQTGFNLRYIHGTDTVLVENVESPYALTNLDDADDYYVQVQVICDEDNWSETLHFVTKQAPATIPYANDFETKNGWAFINGTFANAWAYGEAAHNGEGTHAIYISNNGGAANAYNASPTTVVYATKLFNFEAGSYAFKYDWKCYGEGTSTLWDYLRVVLVPDTVKLEASSDLPSGVTAAALPAGWIALDGGKGLNQKNTWQTFNSDDIAVEAGLYKVVFIWRNDNSTANNPAAAIDNISIKKLTCLKPINLTTSDVYAHSAKLSWSAGEEGQSAWQIALDTIAAFNPDTLSNLIDVNDTSYIFSDLLASHTYYVYVRANCGEDGASDWSAIKSFKTTIACPAPTGLAAELTPGNGTIATLTWNAAEAQAWTVEYSLNSNMSDSLVMNVTEPVANLTGLTAEATYYARVKADCGELDGQSAYSAIISFKPTNLYSIVVNDGTKTNDYVPVYGMYVDNGTTASQFIVPAESLQEIMWDSITTLTFYASQPTSNWGASEFEVYMTTTEDATLGALVDWNSLTQVMVSGNLSIEDNKMVVSLSEPFHYTGDNLLIGFKQTAASGGSSFYSTSSWYGVTASGASIGGYGTGNNMAQRNFLPKMTIAYVPGQAPACMWATHLSVSNITAEGATIAWDDVEGANWEYALVMAGEEPVAFSAAATNPLVLDNLMENTAYVFYLRNNCGSENSKTVSVAFSTIENIEAIPYETQFADAATWKLVNSDNAWTFNGNLFISNDGVNCAYDDEAASVSYATKLFDFDQAGDYTFTYFWKAVGEYNEEDGAIDFLRVALVPAEVQLTAGVAPEGLTAENLPAGWMALDGGAALVATNVFTRQDATINVPAGHYRVAFIWINDDSFTDGEPAAINCLYVKRGDATGLPEAGNAGLGTEAVKFIRDNRVYILVNGTVFDMTGRKVEQK